MEIPTEFVGRYETVDPETEEVLFDGMELKNGMIVMIEDVELRWDVQENVDDRHMYYVMVMNRWCQISNLVRRHGKVEFLATYEDGFQVKRATPLDKAWIVKKASIPPRTEEEWQAEKAIQIAQRARETDPEVGMKLTGYTPNPSTIVSYDTGETQQV